LNYGELLGAIIRSN